MPPRKWGHLAVGVRESQALFSLLANTLLLRTSKSVRHELDEGFSLENISMCQFPNRPPPTGEVGLIDAKKAASHETTLSNSVRLT